MMQISRFWRVSFDDYFLEDHSFLLFVGDAAIDNNSKKWGLYPKCDVLVIIAEPCSTLLVPVELHIF